MIGLFLINDENKLAFAQYGEHQKISQFRFHQDTSMCIVELASGHEESFDDVMHDEIREALERNPTILVGHMTDSNNALDEYDVPVSIVR